MTNMLTGSGPSKGPLFDGDERKFKLWEIKFLGYLRLKKLDTIFTPLPEDANEETRAADATKNADVFAELIQTLSFQNREKTNKNIEKPTKMSKNPEKPSKISKNRQKWQKT